MQALLRGRAEGRLELIKDDKKQVRVVGAGATGVEQARGWRGGMHVVEAGESWVSCGDASELP